MPTVIVKFASEAISIGENNAENALTLSREIIEDTYGKEVANSATYTIEQENN